MTAEQMSGWILLALMAILACIATAFVSGKKYDGRGVYYLTVNAWLRGNKDYRQWTKDNVVYYWVILMVAFLCPTILTLAPSFRAGNMILRPEIMVWLNPFLWAAILLAFRWFFNRIKTYQ